VRPNVGRAWKLERRPHWRGFAGAAFVLSFCACCLIRLAAAAPQQASEQTPAAPVVQISRQATEFILQGFDLLGQHNAPGAEAAFRQAIEVQPEAEPAHRGLGLALREGGRLTDAFRELQTATRLDPSDAEAHYALGSVAWALSTPVSSAPAKAGGLTPADYQNLAVAEFSKALALSPKDVTLRMSLAALYLEADRPHAAVQQAEEAVRIAPDNAAAHVTLGRAYFAGGEEEKAAAEFQAAEKLDPQDGGAYLALGQLRMFQRRNPQAEEAFRHAIQVSPNLGPAYAALAQVLMEDGRGAEARGLLEKAVALNPQDWQSQYQLALLLNQAGESARAAGLLEDVLRTNPDFPGAHEQVAAGLLRRGDAKGATSLAEKMIAQNPQGPEGHRIMALALWKQRDYEGSLAECAMALNGDPNSSAMTALQAIELWQLGHKKEAQMAFREAAKLEPKVASSDVFCRLLLCDAHDISVVSDFLHKIRWVLAPPLTP
jgi:tetratricopeptide (TPR) repeat protein